MQEPGLAGVGGRRPGRTGGRRTLGQRPPCSFRRRPRWLRPGRGRPARGANRPEPATPSCPMPVMMTPSTRPPKAATALCIITSTDGLWPLTASPSKTTAQTDCPEPPKPQMLPPGGNQDWFGCRGIAVLGLLDRQAPRGVKPPGQGLGETGGACAARRRSAASAAPGPRTTTPTPAARPSKCQSPRTPPILPNILGDDRLDDGPMPGPRRLPGFPLPADLHDPPHIRTRRGVNLSQQFLAKRRRRLRAVGLGDVVDRPAIEGFKRDVRAAAESTC